MKKILLGLSLSCLVLLGCKNDDFETLSNPDNTSQIVINLQNLPSLSDSAKYVAWLFFDEKGSTAPVKIGELAPDASGNVSASYTAELYDLKRAQYVVVTVEKPKEDSATVSGVKLPKPSASKLIAGTVSANDVSLSSDASLGLNCDLTIATGKLTLFTPTDANQNTKNGVWFVEYTNGVLSEGLTLPALPSGWKYQGWVSKDGKLISTGTFTTATGVDNSNIYCGSLSIPAFPGEDFLNNAPSGFTFPLDLSGATVFITIEPNAENYDQPYGLKVLSLDIPSSAAAETTLDMAVPTSTVYPSGTVKFNISL